jgi:hypothetical protein
MSIALEGFAVIRIHIHAFCRLQPTDLRVPPGAESSKKFPKMINNCTIKKLKCMIHAHPRKFTIANACY